MLGRTFIVLCVFIEHTDIGEQHLEGHIEYNVIPSKLKYHCESSLLYFPQAKDDLAEIEDDLLSALAFRTGDGNNEVSGPVCTNKASDCIVAGKYLIVNYKLLFF